MKTLTKDETRQVIQALKKLKSLLGLSVRISDFGEVIISGFVVCKFKTDENPDV